MFKRTLISFFFLSAVFLSSCGNHIFDDWNNLLNCTDLVCILEEVLDQTGLLPKSADLDSIPVEPNNVDTTVVAKKMLEDKFPPIGNQGQYGTCVAWATGYNLKTYLNAKDKNWGSSELSKKENQTSPKDLWFVLDKSDRGANCGGTNFEPALEALISKGAASLGSVPYTNMGKCDGTSNGNSSNKLDKYRKIASNSKLAGGTSGAQGMTESNFKSFLAQGRPVLFGAKLGDKFMRWDDASIISSDTYNNSGMQHAYHAMIVSGYDDSKKAFRVRNSWGDGWGDKGSIWVDYDFFLTKFCFVAFVAENGSSNASAKQLLSSSDLQITYAADSVPDKNSPRERVFSYHKLNSGKVTYMYYNAFNINENGIVYEGTAKQQTVSYTMPEINGQYYFVAYAEPNDFYFLAADNGKPLRFVNGVMQNEIASAPNSSARSVQELGGRLNSYTPEEIKRVLRNIKR